MWPGSWDDSTIECLCPHPRFVPSQRRGGCWIFLCGVFVLEGWSSSTRAHSVLCVWCCCGPRLFRIYLMGIFSPFHRNVSKRWILSSISCTNNKQTHTHTRSLASTNTANSNVCIKHLCSALSILLGNFPQQTTAFTMINDVKWRKAVPEWDGRFFSAWKQQFDTD